MLSVLVVIFFRFVIFLGAFQLLYMDLGYNVDTCGHFIQNLFKQSWAISMNFI